MASLRLPLGPRLAAPGAKWAGVLALVLVAGAIAVALAPWGPHDLWMRAGAAMGLVALAGLVHYALSRRRLPPFGWLVLDEAGVARQEGGREARLVDWREPFGATVLASADRATMLIALTSPRATRFISARVVDAEDAAAAPALLERASPVADSDLRLDPAAALSAADAQRLVREIARRAPAALERVFLSDASGEPVVLDRAELRIGARRIDLASPLEWRAFVFQELGVHAATVCQATWVRQAEAEVVLVAPMPGDANWRASAADPPPRELRRAIDGVFMIPLRRALDRAPRSSRVPSPPSRTMQGQA